MMLTPNINKAVIEAYDFIRYTTSNTGCWALAERDGGLPQIRIHLSVLNGDHHGVHRLFEMVISEMERDGYGHCGFINHSIYS